MRLIRKIALAFPIILAAGLVGAASQYVVMDPLDLAQIIVVPPSDFRDAPAVYSAAEMNVVLPHIKVTACIFTQHLIRHWLRPDAVGFEPCAKSPFAIKFSEDLIYVSVTGAAQVGDRNVRFDVDLQHYPRATELGGFQTLRVDFPQGGATLAVAGAP